MESQAIILTILFILALLIIIHGVRKGIRENPSTAPEKQKPRLEEQIAPFEYDESNFMPMGGLMPVDREAEKPNGE